MELSVAFLHCLPQSKFLQESACQVSNERSGLFVPSVEESKRHNVRDVVEGKGVYYSVKDEHRQGDRIYHIVA